MQLGACVNLARCAPYLWDAERSPGAGLEGNDQPGTILRNATTGIPEHAYLPFRAS